MAMPRGVPTSSAPRSPAHKLEAAKEQLRNNYWKHNLLLPGMQGLRKGLVPILVIDDDEALRIDIGYMLLACSRAYNALFARTTEEEVWAYPVFASTVSEGIDLARTSSEILIALVDIKMPGDGRTGMDVAVEIRGLFPDAIIIMHSSWAAGLSTDLKYQTADIGLPKQQLTTDVRARFVFQLALLHPRIRTCGICPLYDDRRMACTITGKNETLRFLHSTICPLLLQKPLEDACKAIVAKGGNPHMVPARIKAVGELLGSIATPSMRAAVEARERMRASTRGIDPTKPIPLSPAEVVAGGVRLKIEEDAARLDGEIRKDNREVVCFRKRYPIVASIVDPTVHRDQIERTDFFPFDPLHVEAAGVPLLRDPKTVKPPEAIRELADRLSIAVTKSKF